MNTFASQETVHELFNRAFALHQANKPKDAQPLYEEVLAHEPQHAHAIHSLGVIASADGRLGEAIGRRQTLGKRRVHKPCGRLRSNGLDAHCRLFRVRMQVGA